MTLMAISFRKSLLRSFDRQTPVPFRQCRLVLFEKIVIVHEIRILDMRSCYGGHSPEEEATVTPVSERFFQHVIQMQFYYRVTVFSTRFLNFEFAFFSQIPHS